MRVLVTGCHGQVGSEVVALADEAFDVCPFGHRELDITRADAVKRRLDEAAPDVVVNCAAYTAVDRAEDEPEVAHLVNADAVGLLGNACAARGIGIIHLSTDYVFDGRKPAPYREEDHPNPLGVYGASKLAGEERLRGATDRHVVLRLSWVFGRIGHSFVDTILRLARDRDTLTVVDDQVGTPTPAAAIATAIRSIAETTDVRPDAWGTYHYSATPAVSWCGFARCIVAAAAEYNLLADVPAIEPIRTADWGAKAARPLNSRLDATRAATVFGTKPVSWEAHLRDYLQSRRL